VRMPSGGSASRRHGYPNPKLPRLWSSVGGSWKTRRARRFSLWRRYFESGGAGYPDYLARDDSQREHGRATPGSWKPHTTPGSMLDVGCAAGFICRGFCDSGWSGSGVEPNATMARFGRENSGVDIAASTSGLRRDRRYDLVTMIQVLPTSSIRAEASGRRPRLQTGRPHARRRPGTRVEFL